MSAGDGADAVSDGDSGGSKLREAGLDNISVPKGWRGQEFR